MIPPAAPPRDLARFAWFTLGFNVLVVLWGAVVRATGSGAGCGAHWPTCNGEVVPLIPSIATAIEFTHRATSGLALLLVAALCWHVFQQFERGALVRAWAVASMVLILSEAAIGAGLVLYRKVADDTSLSRGLWISGHLVNTFLLLAALTLTARLASARDRLWSSGLSGLMRATFPNLVRRRAAAVGMTFLLATGVSGAIAALGDTLFKVETLREGLAQDLSPASHLFVRLRVFHPVIALLAGLVVLAVVYRPATASDEGSARGLARFLAALVFGQWILGLVNVLLLAPTGLQIAHLLVADVIWISLILYAAADDEAPLPVSR